jgi:hypothetical protein
VGSLTNDPCPQGGRGNVGFSEEAQGWLPCKITTLMDDKWQIEWWDGSQTDKIKDKTELHHFEEAGWWYRITGKSLSRKCHHCQNTDGSQGQWRTQDEWEMSDWRGQRENARCKECSKEGRPHHERPSPKGRGKMTRPQMVLVCQSANTRLSGEDGDHVGTMKLSEIEFHRILEHGRHFPFLTSKEREEGGNGHWRTRMWETSAIEIWGTTRDLGFPVSKDKDLVRENPKCKNTEQRSESKTTVKKRTLELELRNRTSLGSEICELVTCRGLNET